MSKQLYSDGDVITDDNGEQFEVTAVSNRVTHPDGTTDGYTYHIQLKSERDSEREAQAKLEAEQKAQAEEAERVANLDPADRLKETGNT